MSVLSLLAVASSAASTLPGTAPAQDMSPITSMLQIMLPIIVIFYFFILRPNQKKIRDFDAMVKALRRGDKVVTGGGIIGTIQKLEGDDILLLEIAPDVKVRVMRDSISHVVSKTVANDNKADAKSEDKTNAN